MVARRAADTVFRASPPSENYRVVSGYHTLAAAVCWLFSIHIFLISFQCCVFGHWLADIVGRVDEYGTVPRSAAEIQFPAKGSCLKQLFS